MAAPARVETRRVKKLWLYMSCQTKLTRFDAISSFKVKNWGPSLEARPRTPEDKKSATGCISARMRIQRYMLAIDMGCVRYGLLSDYEPCRSRVVLSCSIPWHHHKYCLEDFFLLLWVIRCIFLYWRQDGKPYRFTPPTQDWNHSKTKYSESIFYADFKSEKFATE